MINQLLADMPIKNPDNFHRLWDNVYPTREQFVAMVNHFASLVNLEYHYPYDLFEIPYTLYLNIEEGYIAISHMYCQRGGDFKRQVDHIHYPDDLGLKPSQIRTALLDHTPIK